MLLVEHSDSVSFMHEPMDLVSESMTGFSCTSITVELWLDAELGGLGGGW